MHEGVPREERGRAVGAAPVRNRAGLMGGMRKGPSPAYDAQVAASSGTASGQSNGAGPSPVQVPAEPSAGMVHAHSSGGSTTPLPSSDARPISVLRTARLSSAVLPSTRLATR